MATTPKIALVTGGSQGLGKDMALQLARHEHDVVVTYRHHPEEAAAVVAQIRAGGRQALALPFDVADSRTFDQFLRELTMSLLAQTGRPNFDFLINNAGSGADTLIADTPEAVLDELYRLHVKGPYLLTQKALPFLNDGGWVINLASGLTRFTTLGRSAYATMKGAVETFACYLAKEVGPRGITANSVAPGLIQTNFTQATFARPENVAHIESITALGRTGTPEDIGGVVAFLCSDEARWITGQRLEVSGGMNL